MTAPPDHGKPHRVAYPHKLRHLLWLTLSLICLRIAVTVQSQVPDPKPDILPQQVQRAMLELKSMGMEADPIARKVKFKWPPISSSQDPKSSNADRDSPDYWPRLTAALSAFGCKELILVAVELPKELPCLGELLELESLYLAQGLSFQSLPDLSRLTQLREVTLFACTGLKGNAAFHGLSGIRNLEKLSFHRCIGLMDTAPLADLTQLKELNLNGCTGLQGREAFRGLGEMRSLQTLSLSGCTGLMDTAPLAEMAQLTELYLSNCSGLKDSLAIDGLTKLSGLKRLDLTGCTGLNAETLLVLRRRLPVDCRIAGPDGLLVEP